MNYPNKPWNHGQTHEIISGKQFQYDSDSRVWKRLKTEDVSVEAVRQERDSDLSLFVSRRDYDSDSLNMNGDFGAF